ncbi:K(+)/H(+) antiporter NhaP [Acaryochloris thomasi RCC1774]|uniref:K(+)/H(+) antiporter NhaP n=1 Tax=Acaryochloris thomasi RCC1774 TaxID=1764569 RepID=A0A2W1JJ47_9CYAN|nr:cation:proton antiporter [Acaryochloris thomasi]PZD71072.1 K(+)/H(+) antiporter NhaP [Acaryochloris thomasi RCC1774]
MLGSAIWILLAGFFAGQLARRIGAPPLIGMILAGIGLGPELANVLDSSVLDSADDLRTVAVMVILMRAGLGLDRKKLQQQGTVALRLGLLPVIAEATVVMTLAMVLFQFDWVTGLLLGCVVGAESPAVIVPGMLRLKSLGFGVAKGIPDAILTGSALSDVLVLLVFSLLLTVITGSAASSAWLLPVQVLGQIVLGIALGYLAARLMIVILVRQNWSQTAVHDLLITASTALLMVLAAQKLPYFSGYLAAMALGFFLIELDPPLARRLRLEFNNLWSIAEILLFVLLGASIQIRALENTLLPGLLILVVGLLLGRSIGWFLSTWGSNWTLREKLFLLPGNSAKATVQAAIGAVPLSQGIEGGEVILAIAALSILTTAPFGAWAIPTFAPKLLSKDPVDPTKVAVQTRPLLMAAVDTSPLAPQVLAKAAELARRSDGEVMVLHIAQAHETDDLKALQSLSQRLLLDVRHRFHILDGPIPDVIVHTAQQYRVSDIVIGKRGHQAWENLIVGSVSQAVLESSPIPVTIVEASSRESSLKGNDGANDP